MTVKAILSRKGRDVLTIAPTASLSAAVQLLAERRIGALVVTTGRGSDTPDSCDHVVGMFTERDVLARVVGEERQPATTRVEEVMTADVAYCRPETPIEELGAIMRERRIRHLPVCDSGGALQGLVSIGDLNAWHADGQATEIHYLNEYIHGRV